MSVLSLEEAMVDARPMISALIAERPALVEYLDEQLFYARHGIETIAASIVTLMLTLDPNNGPAYNSGMGTIAEQYAVDIVSEYRHLGTTPLEWLGHGEQSL